MCIRDSNRIVEESPVLSNLEFINPGMIDYTNFNLSLEAASNTFDKHRYIYEGVPDAEEWRYGRLIHQSIRNVTTMDLRLADLVLSKDDS